MLATIEIVHSSNFLHGDIKPDNWLLQRGKCSIGESDELFHSAELTLIDFGRAIDFELYPENTLFTGDCHTKGFKCIEMLTHQPWSYQIDTFGICASAHFLLFGEYMQVKCTKTSTYKKETIWSIRNTWKRYWQTQLWQSLFHPVLNMSTSTTNPICISAIRHAFELYYTNNPAHTRVLHIYVHIHIHIHIYIYNVICFQFLQELQTQLRHQDRLLQEFPPIKQ